MLSDIVQDRFSGDCGHTTDMICQFAGYCPVAVFARGKVLELDVPSGYEPEPELLNMIVEFKNGVIGTQIGHAGDHGTYYCDVVGMIDTGAWVTPMGRN